MQSHAPSERIESLFGHLEQIESAKLENRVLLESVDPDASTVLGALEAQAEKLDHAAAQVLRAIKEHAVGASGGAVSVDISL